MSSDGIREIGVGMLGYAFMGKAHSNAFRKIAYMTWPPPLQPRLVAIAGRNEDAVSRCRDALRLRALDSPTGRTSWPIPQSGSSTTSAPTRCMPSDDCRCTGGQARRLREAARARRRRELRDLASSRCNRRQAPVCLQLPLCPAVRLAGELIDAGELGEIRHFRGRYLQGLGDTPPRSGASIAPKRARARSVIWPPTSSTSAPPRRRDRRGRRLLDERSSLTARSTTTPGRPRVADGRSARSGRRGSLSVAATRSSGDQRHEGSLAFDMERLIKLRSLETEAIPARGGSRRARFGGYHPSGSTGGRPATSSAGATPSSRAP